MARPRSRLAVGAALAASVALAVGGCAGGDPDSALDTSGVPSVSATAVVDPAQLVTNGIDDSGPDEAVAAARDALGEARSFRVVGSPSQGAPLDLVYVDDDVVGSTGTVTQRSATFELVAVNGDVYVRGDLEWLGDRVAQGARRTLGESWLLLPEDATDGLEVFVDPESLVDSLLPAGPVRSVGVSLIDGVPALGVQYVDSEATVWVSGVGEPYPRLVERVGATATDGVLRVVDVDAEVDLGPPRPRDVVVVPDDS